MVACVQFSFEDFTSGGEDGQFYNPGDVGADCSTPACAPCATGTVTAVASVQSDWGGGYCVHLDVTNQGSAPTTNWSVGLDLHGSQITNGWNGTFSGTFSGTITASPALAWSEI